MLAQSRSRPHLTSAMRNMNFSCPSRRAIAAHSEMNTDRPRCFGCESLAKMMPKLIASRIMPEMFWSVRNNADAPHTPTVRPPKPMVACRSLKLQRSGFEAAQAPLAAIDTATAGAARGNTSKQCTFVGAA